MLCEYCGRFNKDNKKEDCSSCGALLPRDKGGFIVHPGRNYSDITGVHVFAGGGGGCGGASGGSSGYGRIVAGAGGGGGDGRVIYR